MKVFVLGAPDPEMTAIESLLKEQCLHYIYATVDGRRVHPGNAYRADPVGAKEAILVECGLQYSPETTVVVGHHREGDPGYGCSPAEFLTGSSVGQVLGIIGAPLSWPRVDCSQCDTDHAQGRGVIFSHGKWCVSDGLYLSIIPQHILLAAAADHCLAAAYAGQCPGVDPDALMKWRVEARAAFQSRSVEAVLADVQEARVVLREAPEVPHVYRVHHDVIDPSEADTGFGLMEQLCGYYTSPNPSRIRNCSGMPVLTGSEEVQLLPGVADLRGRDVPELPEAACRDGHPYIATVKDRDGREKVVLGAATPPVVAAFMKHWSHLHGLCEVYGDPARGFAGGYK